MKNSEFRTPLLQSGAILVAIVFIFSMVPSSDSAGVGSVIGSLFSGILHTILFAIALTFAITFSIAVLIGIFLGSLALHDQERATFIYADLRMKLSELWGEVLDKLTCSAKTGCATGVSGEEYNQMMNEISELQQKNGNLQSDISTLQAKNEQLQNDIHELSNMVDNLQQSEVKIHELLADLTAKVEQEPDTSLKEQIQELEGMSRKIVTDLTILSDRLEGLESVKNQPQTAGIFSYIENQVDQELLTTQVQEAIAQEMTYAQIDEFLTNNLPLELDTIIKDHPSLTKDYIRSLRK